MNSTRVSHPAIAALHTKVAFILLPSLVYAVLPTHRAAAQVIPTENGTQSTVEAVDSQLNILGGQSSADGSNLFHSFEQFSLEAAQTANFIAVPKVQNIIGTVSSNQVSTIDGTLQISGSDASLYLMNPAGVLLGPNARLNLAGGFSATTATGIEFGKNQLSIENGDSYAALMGNPSAFRFDGMQAAGPVVNLGDLSVDEGEAISLIGGTVVNAGSLSAPQGTVTIAAVENENLVRINQSNQLLSLEVEATDALLLGKHEIVPTSIGEMLTGEGLDQGTRLVVDADGTARISGSAETISEAGGTAIASGTITTEGKVGGNINVLGNQVALEEAQLNVSGTQGGGLIRIGGDRRGEGNIVSASRTFVDNRSVLVADATEIGNGGNIIVWADDTTRYAGHLSARGGAASGDGGFAEISGKEYLATTGSADLRAANGERGTILFDPRDVVITDNPATPINGGDTHFSSAEIEALSATADVILEANNNITIESITDETLSLFPGSSITLRADANRIDGGEFRMSETNTIRVEAGNISIFGAGVTAGNLIIDPKYKEGEENSSAIGNILIESSAWLSAENIVSERGDITLLADDIAVGSIDTSTEAHNSGGDTLNGRSKIAAGNVDIISEGSITVGEILTYGLLTTDEHHSPDGGDVTITSLGGDIRIENTIETYSHSVASNKAREAGSAGNIELGAAGSIFIDNSGGAETALNASSLANSHDVGDGGDIILEAVNGQVGIQGNITTSAETLGQYSRSNSVAGQSGDIEIRANGDITTSAIMSRAIAQSLEADESGDIAGAGGDIVIRSISGDATLGKIESYSSASGDTALGGGDVFVSADNIFVEGIDASSQASSNAQAAGDVTVDAQSSVAINGDIAAHSATDDAGDISLRGDDIDISDNRISGASVRLSPSTESRNINVGFNSETDDALGISVAEIAAIESSTLEIGSEASSGTIALSESVLNTDNRPKIHILGSDRLIGPNIPTGSLIYALIGKGEGSIEGADLSFSSIEEIQGGSGDDIFKLGLDAEIGDFEAISGGAGDNALSYESFINQPLTVDLSQSRLSNLKLIGPTTQSTLRGEDRTNLWAISDVGQGTVNNSIEFENFENIVGGSELDTLDYSEYETVVSVDIGGQSTGIRSFSNIENIIGSAANGDQLTGSSDDDTFTLGERSSVNAIDFVGFERLSGSDGINTFVIEQNAPSFDIAGGSDLDDGLSQNRIVANSSTANWKIAGKNRGTLEQSGTVFEFEEIQQIENSGIGIGEVEVRFARFDSQITGSISSGESNLTLIGDDINVGLGTAERDNRGGQISGSGILTIRPETDGIEIEIGGRDGFSANRLNITDGEIAAIQDGFSEIRFGDRAMTGNILLGNDVRFDDAVSISSQGSIDTTKGQLSVSQGNLTLSSGQSIIGDAVASLGGDVSAIAQESIQLGDITTVGTLGSGNLELVAANGTITTGGIITSEANNSGSAGSVQLSSLGSIEIEFIEAEGQGTNGSDPRVEISTYETFTATGGETNSISTAGSGVEEGSIRITFGDERATAESFSIGSNSTAPNNTVGAIASGQTSIAAGKFAHSYSQDNIELINRGIAVLEDADPPMAEDLGEMQPMLESHQFALQASVELPALITISSAISAEEDAVFEAIEARAGQEFAQYFTLDKTDEQSPATLIQAQQKLEEIQSMSGVTPALVYVYFVPDAASATAVRPETHVAHDNDQLEVMLVTGQGQPTRHRQWGITRAQVDEAARSLRREVTSQFSTQRQYLPPAQQLYEWIMRPLLEGLEEQQVQSLGFVMETGLRTMPIAALHDGDRYLVENYSLGILPTFSLTEFSDTRTQNNDFRNEAVLAMGASEFEKQPDLPAVKKEISLIADQLWQGDAFLNEDFVLDKLQAQMAENDYGILHLATHATFEADDLEGSYIQMWDEQLALSEVSELGLSDADIGLIILSACNTAVGDRNSEYGFAGFAVSAGSPSALASLWPVSDEGTLGFMSQFYAGLRPSPIRAEALRQAQTSMISGEVGIDYGKVYGPAGAQIVTIPELAESGQWDFSHPFYWSAFTMIGNPW